VDTPQGRNVVLVCTLAHPNDKFLPLVFAADTARELGATKVGLVAPYLCYMRQDQRFTPGEAVTSRSFAALLSRSLDWMVTVDPHLHRYRSLEEIYSMPCRVLHAAPALATWIQNNVPRPFLIGPDAESRQWIESVAKSCGAAFTILEKTRTGDSTVAALPLQAPIPDGATPIVLDDIVSSGATLLETLRLLGLPGRTGIAVVVHGLHDQILANKLRETGARLITTNSIPNPEAAIDISNLIAAGIAELI
jgi:ribose-phosphate pyrophosphokinase